MNINYANQKKELEDYLFNVYGVNTNHQCISWIGEVLLTSPIKHQDKNYVYFTARSRDSQTKTNRNIDSLIKNKLVESIKTYSLENYSGKALTLFRMELMLYLELVSFYDKYFKNFIKTDLDIVIERIGGNGR